MSATNSVLKCSAILFALMSLAASAARADMAIEPRVQRGLNFARENCSKCHAIGIAGASPLSEAPPFRTLHTRYPLDDLTESFSEGIVTGHPSMPEWRLDPGQIDDLISYLKSVQDRS